MINRAGALRRRQKKQQERLERQKHNNANAAFGSGNPTTSAGSGQFGGVVAVQSQSSFGTPPMASHSGACYESAGGLGAAGAGGNTLSGNFLFPHLQRADTAKPGTIHQENTMATTTTTAGGTSSNHHQKGALEVVGDQAAVIHSTLSAQFGESSGEKRGSKTAGALVGALTQQIVPSAPPRLLHGAVAGGERDRKSTVSFAVDTSTPTATTTTIATTEAPGLTEEQRIGERNGRGSIVLNSSAADTSASVLQNPFLSQKEVFWIDTLTRFGDMEEGKAEEYAAVFKANNIPYPTCDAVCFMNRDLLVKGLGIKDPSDILQIITAVKKLPAGYCQHTLEDLQDNEREEDEFHSQVNKMLGSVSRKDFAAGDGSVFEAPQDFGVAANMSLTYDNEASFSVGIATAARRKSLGANARSSQLSKMRDRVMDSGCFTATAADKPLNISLTTEKKKKKKKKKTHLIDDTASSHQIDQRSPNVSSSREGDTNNDVTGEEASIRSTSKQSISLGHSSGQSISFTGGGGSDQPLGPETVVGEGGLAPRDSDGRGDGVTSKTEDSPAPPTAIVDFVPPPANTTGSDEAAAAGGGGTGGEGFTIPFQEDASEVLLKVYASAPETKVDGDGVTRGSPSGSPKLNFRLPNETMKSGESTVLQTSGSGKASDPAKLDSTRQFGSGITGLLPQPGATEDKSFSPAAPGSLHSSGPISAQTAALFGSMTTAGGAGIGIEDGKFGKKFEYEPNYVWVDLVGKDLPDPVLLAQQEQGRNPLDLPSGQTMAQRALNELQKDEHNISPSWGELASPASPKTINPLNFSSSTAAFGGLRVWDHCFEYLISELDRDRRASMVDVRAGNTYIDPPEESPLGSQHPLSPGLLAKKKGGDYNDMSRRSQRSESQQQGPASRLLRLLDSKTLPLPQFVRDKYQPACCAFVLRACTLDANVDMDNVRDLTNRWTVYIDCALGNVATIHRVDSLGMAMMRGYMESSEYSTQLSQQLPHQQLRLEDFLAQLVELFIEDYEKAIALSAFWLDECEALILTAAAGKKVSTSDVPAGPSFGEENDGGASSSLSPTQLGGSSSGGGGGRGKSGGKFMQFFSGATGLINGMMSPHSAKSNDSKPSFMNSSRRSASFSQKKSGSTLKRSSSRVSFRGRKKSDAQEENNNNNDLSEAGADQGGFKEKEDEHDGGPKATRDLTQGDLLFRLFKLQRRATIYDRMIQLSRAVIMKELTRQTDVSNPDLLRRRFDKMHESVIQLRIRAQTLLELHISITTFHTTKLISVLTMVTIMFVPITFLCALWGMNFENMPELNWSGSYFIVVPLMLTIALCCFWAMQVFFKGTLLVTRRRGRQQKLENMSQAIKSKSLAGAKSPLFAGRQTTTRQDSIFDRVGSFISGDGGASNNKRQGPSDSKFREARRRQSLANHQY